MTFEEMIKLESSKSIGSTLITTNNKVAALEFVKKLYPDSLKVMKEAVKKSNAFIESNGVLFLYLNVSRSVPLSVYFDKMKDLAKEINSKEGERVVAIIPKTSSHSAPGHFETCIEVTKAPRSKEPVRCFVVRSSTLPARTLFEFEYKREIKAK